MVWIPISSHQVFHGPSPTRHLTKTTKTCLKTRSSSGTVAFLGEQRALGRQDMSCWNPHGQRTPHLPKCINGAFLSHRATGWGPSSLAKLVYSYNNNSVWYIMILISILRWGYKPTSSWAPSCTPVIIQVGHFSIETYWSPWLGGILSKPLLKLP